MSGVDLLVTGARGLLGSDVLVAAAARDMRVVPCGRAELDVTDRDGVLRTLSEHRPAVVVHCAAYTAVDDSEREPELAMRVNRDGTRHVAEAAAEVGAHLVAISTDYVFDGARKDPYPPDAETNPLSHYATTKLEGERAALSSDADVLVARVSWLFGGARRCFTTMMVDFAREGRALTVVSDQLGGPTWTADVAETLLDLVETRATGIWHIANRGACSKADLAEAAIELAGVDHPIARTTAEQYAEEFGALAIRPDYSVLDVTATEARIGRKMPEWRDALARFMATR